MAVQQISSLHNQAFRSAGPPSAYGCGARAGVSIVKITR
jgi:hypothetical protein